MSASADGLVARAPAGAGDRARSGAPVAPLEAVRGLRVALAGGGTGGHVVPGLHLLRHVVEERPDELDAVLWFGAGRAVERRARARAEGLDAVPMEVVDLPLEPAGGGAPTTGALLARTLPATRTARRALERGGADVVCGLGGFTSLPVVLAARSLGIPVALLEINAVRGRATRWLAPLAKRVCHAWPGGVRATRDVCTGPPLGPEHLAPPLTAKARAAEREALGVDPARPLVAVLGGSQGAGFLNGFFAERAASLVARGLSIVHQTGPGRASEGAAEVEHYVAFEFSDQVDRLLRAADVVVCRGGASTLAEVAAAGVPAVVVPYPHHRDGHQRRNAEALGSGALVVEEARGADVLERELLALARDGARLERAREALADAIPRDGAARLFDELVLLSASRVSHSPRR